LYPKIVKSFLANYSISLFFCFKQVFHKLFGALGPEHFAQKWAKTAAT
jgi:hypothetical protein